MQKKEPRYEDGVEYWQCTTCKRWLQRNEYYKDTRRSSGLKTQCKQCHTATALKTRDKVNARRINREHMRRARNTNPDKFRIRELNFSRNHTFDTGKLRARAILNQSVLSGKIIKPTNCSKCGRLRKVNGHHKDYNKPLEVIWLCSECHGEARWND